MEYDSTFKLHLRAACAFLGLPKNVSLCGLISDLDWLLPHYQTQVRIIRHFSHVLKTPDHRLLKGIYKWDKNLNDCSKISSWSSEVKSILYNSSLNHVYDGQQMFPIRNIVQQLKNDLFKKQQTLLENECKAKPKLRTFVTFKDFKTLPPHIFKPLTFLERKIISKTRLGILPLRIETSRYLRLIVPPHCVGKQNY